MLRRFVVTAGAVALALAPAPALAAKKPPPNTLIVKVAGLPAGVKAPIRVKGPDGFTKRLQTRKKKLKHLDPGRYRVRTTAVNGYTPTKTKAKVKATLDRGNLLRIKAQLATAFRDVKVKVKTVLDKKSVQAVFAERDTTAPPRDLPDPPGDWRVPFAAIASTPSSPVYST